MRLKSHFAVLAFEVRASFSPLARAASFAKHVLGCSLGRKADCDVLLTGASTAARVDNTRRLQELLARIGPDDFCQWAAYQARNGLRDPDGLWSISNASCAQSRSYPSLARELALALERGEPALSLSRRSSVFLSGNDRDAALAQLLAASEHPRLTGAAGCCGVCKTEHGSIPCAELGSAK